MAEIISCPACSRTLQVPEEYFGKTVQCPECKQMFEARPTAAANSAPVNSASASSTPARSAAGPAPTGYSSETDLFPGKQPAARDYEDEQPRSRRSEYDDDNDRPRRRLAEHRGGLVLAFGILGITGIAPIPFAPIAWFLGNSDLKEMREGRMDPSGEGLTNVGRVLGMISTLMIVASLALLCVFLVFMVLAGVAGVAHGG